MFLREDTIHLLDVVCFEHIVRIKDKAAVKGIRVVLFQMPQQCLQSVTFADMTLIVSLVDPCPEERAMIAVLSVQLSAGTKIWSLFTSSEKRLDESYEKKY